MPDNTSLASAIVSTNGGVYSNPTAGMVSDRGDGKGVAVPAGEYLLVASTFKPEPGSFEITVWSTSQSVSVTPV